MTERTCDESAPRSRDEIFSAAASRRRRPSRCSTRTARAVRRRRLPRASSCSRTPNGTRNALFWPTGTETNFKLNTFTPDLEPFKSKLTFLKGIKLNPALQNGALGGTVGSEHARGTGRHADGAAAQVGNAVQELRQHDVGLGQRPVARSVPGRPACSPTTTFPSLQVGVHVRDTEVRARISYAGADMPIPPREDPKDVFSALFGMATSRG